MHRNTSTNAIVARPPPAGRRIMNAGAHRGALENVPAFVEYNALSTAAPIVPVYVDPMPGRAEEMRKVAEGHGLAAEAVQGRIEEAIAEGDNNRGIPLVLNLDRASAIARVFQATLEDGRPTLGYLLLKLPSGRLWAVRFAIEADDRLARQSAITFFERLASVSERNTSDGILGAMADPAHVLAEPVMRQWFADHCVMNLAKITADLEPVSDTFEVSTNGKDTWALHIVARDSWSDPATLAEEVVADPASPIRRGVQFVVCEVTPAGLRFHEVRRRTDNRITVHGADTLDRAAIEAQERSATAAAKMAERDVALRSRTANEATTAPTPDHAALVEPLGRATAVIARAERETVNRSNPVRTTD